VDIYGADGHDLLALVLSQVADQVSDEGVQLAHLLLVVIFQRVLVAFL